MSFQISHQIAERLAGRIGKLGLSLNQFSVLCGLSCASLSRKLSGSQGMTASEVDSFEDLLTTLEDVIAKLRPIKIDLTAPDARLWLMKLRLGKLVVSPVLDTDPDNSKTKDELAQIVNQYQAGIEALSKTIGIEPQP